MKSKSYKNNNDNNFAPYIVNYLPFKKIRLIDEKNIYYDNFNIEDAKRKAKINDLDLVCFFKPEKNDSRLPLCKIINYGKWKYENDKNDKKSKKNSNLKQITKELQFSYNILQHDIDRKIDQAKKFLEQNMDVKLIMKLFGRSKDHFDLADKKMSDIVNSCLEFGKIHDSKKTDSSIFYRLTPK